MKQRQSARTHASSLKLAVLFCSLVGLFLLSALSIRIFHTAEKNVFDPERQFILLLHHDDQYLLSVFNPSSKTVDTFPIEALASESVSNNLHIGIDGKVDIDSNLTSDIQSNLFTAIFHAQTTETNVTWIDLARLYLLARGSIVTQHATLQLPQQHLDQDTIRKIFSDTAINREDATIQIINASDASGLGTRLSSLIANMGGNVIDIRTAINSQSHSEIAYYGTISYTATRLSHILGFPLRQEKERPIADIVIIIGKDSAATDRF